MEHQTQDALHLTHGFLAETDGSLAARAATDHAALTELYHRYLPGVDRYCRLRLRDPMLIEDVVSQVFLRVIEGLRKTRVEQVRPWIYAIAHNEVVNAYRQRQVTALDSVPDRPSPDKSPEELAIQLGDIEDVRGLLNRLSSNERQVVELRLSGLTNSEISAALGKSYAWVGTNQYRALRRMRALLDSDQGART